MSTVVRGRRQRTPGQVIPIFGVALVAIVAMIALVLEGGNAYAQQRVTQNGADAAANAGTVVIAESRVGAPRTDAMVLAAIQGTATPNQIATFTAFYTDVNGNSLGTQVGAAPGNTIPANAQGVTVRGTRNFGTFFARVLGISSFDAAAEATVITGPSSGVCAAAQGCGLLPVTFPVLISACDPPHDTTSIGQGPYTETDIDARTASNESIVPLCTTDPGSVGWLDLGSGNLAEQISTSNHGSFDLPTWLQTQTGNVNALENEINSRYAGKIILIPMFDGTCRVQPAGSALNDCPASQVGVGTGNNTWYHIPKFTGFFLDRAYTSGSDVANCNSAPGSPFVGGNGSVGCMKGWFIYFLTEGPVDTSGASPVPGDPTAYSIQLIK